MPNDELTPSRVSLSLLAGPGPAPEVLDTLPGEDISNYSNMVAAIPQTLNLSPEPYWWRLRKSHIGPDHHPRITGRQSGSPACGGCALNYIQKIKYQRPSWWRITPLPYLLRPRTGCNATSPPHPTLEEAITLMEVVYASMVASLYLIPKAWKRQAEYVRF